MSVLLIGSVSALREDLARKLLAEADEVRAVENEEAAAAALARLGVHVARGRRDDADLVERAARNVRTLVLLEPRGEELGAALDGVAALEGSVRIVVWSPSPSAELVTALRVSGSSYVLLHPGAPRRWRRRRAVPRPLLLEAVNAADDVAGTPHLEIDLSDPAGLGELGLEPAGRRHL